MRTPKFKIGDRVKIIKGRGGMRGTDIGKVYKITYIVKDSNGAVYYLENNICYYNEHYLRLLNGMDKAVERVENRRQSKNSDKRNN